jgi:uncharacterized protein
MARVVHFELGAHDPERAVQFYEKVFGWKINKWEGEFDYWLVTTGEQGTPGIDGAILRRDAKMPEVVNTIDVESLDDSLAQVTANGGTVVTPRQTLPGIGYFAYCQDTEGNTFGMMQSDPSATA